MRYLKMYWSFFSQELWVTLYVFVFEGILHVQMVETLHAVQSCSSNCSAPVSLVN